MEARSQTLSARPAGFAAWVHAGEVLHLWQKPVEAAGSSLLRLRDADGRTARLSGPPTDDFQMTTHRVAASGKIAVDWDETGTLVSLCYAYDPARVAEDGIRVLWTSRPASPNTRRNRLHLAPPFGWMNDPNGMVQLGDRVHAFYQHYPHAKRWDTMHWGHAVSGNMVDWTHCPVFLHPRPAMLEDDAKKGGAFSGSAIARPDGGLRIFHTDREDNRAPEQEWQMTAVSADLIGAGPSTALIEDRPPLEGFGRDLRDPYVFKGADGLWKMVLGGHDQTAALVLLYETDDPEALGGWRFVDPLHREPLPRTVPAECPCVIPLDGEGEGLHALVFGLIGHQSLVNGRLNPSFALVGRFDGKHFVEIARRDLDFVGDCYAFQSFEVDGRPMGIAWAANWADVRRTQDFPSAMTFVRRLIWKDGALLMPPVEAVAELRRERLAGSADDLRHGVDLLDGLAEIGFDLTLGASFRLTLSHPDYPIVLTGDGETLELVAEWAVTRARGIRYRTETGPLRQIRVFIDVGLIEVYANEGRWCGTKRIDSDKSFTAVELDAEAAQVVAAEAWHLRPQLGSNH